MGPMARSLVPRLAFPIPECMRLYWAESIRIPRPPGPGIRCSGQRTTRVSRQHPPPPRTPGPAGPGYPRWWVARPPGIRGPRAKSQLYCGSQPLGRWRVRWSGQRLANLQPLRQGPVWPCAMRSGAVSGGSVTACTLLHISAPDCLTLCHSATKLWDRA